jgi:tripartite-type tricarboxylate transporter receptor subunit TctC
MRTSMRSVVALAAVIGGISNAVAQNWPTRQVTLVVPYAAGAASDIVARIIAPRLSELLGQPVIIENIAGAGGLTGSIRVARAAPDFHQIVLGNSGTHAQNQSLYKRPPYNPATDFAPVALIGKGAMVLIVRNELPANTLPEFISYAKANEAKMQYGSAGPGSAIHLACLLFNAAVGLNVTHVPYRASSAALQDLIPGRIDYMCPVDGSVIAQIDSKAVKAIAVLRTKRSPILPKLPTASEQGLTDFDTSLWWALFLPKGAPAAIVQRLHEATIAMMDTPSVQERMRELGVDLAEPELRSSEYLRTFVESEIDKWAAPIKASGLSMD